MSTIACFLLVGVLVVVFAVALSLGVFAVARRRIRAERENFLEQLKQCELRCAGEARAARRWYALSSVRFDLDAYVAAVRQWEKRADGYGDDEDYTPDRQTGGENDYEGQELLRAEAVLRNAVVAIVNHPENRIPASTIVRFMEEDLEGQLGCNYRTSYYKVLESSWNRLLQQP